MLYPCSWSRDLPFGPSPSTSADRWTARRQRGGPVPQVLADTPSPEGSERSVVSVTPDDMAAYVGTLFDAFIADPGLIRLTQWKALERPDKSQAELETHLSKALAERLMPSTE